MNYKDWINRLPLYKPPELIGTPPKTMIKLSSNENALGPSPRAIAAMQTALEGVARYPDSSVEALRRALAERAGLTPEAVLCGNGSDELISLICQGLLREGDQAVMARGTFISYLIRTQMMGAESIQVPLSNYTHDLEAMTQALTPKTRVVFLCSPNNPTGTISKAREMATFLEHVPDNTLIVVDEAYREYVTHPDYPDLLSELRNGRRNLVLLRTFSKIYGLAGLRLGYAYGHPEVISYLERVRPIFSVNSIAQVAGLAALEDTEHLERSRTYAQQCRTMFYQELTALGLRPIPTETNFVAVDVGDDRAVSRALYQRGFMVSPLSGWNLPGCIRITFGTEPENRQFFAALRAVLEYPHRDVQSSPA